MSFKEIYFKYYPELVRYGRQLNVDKVDIEDFVQETFMKYHIELSKDVVFENTRAWLYKVLLNLVITKNNTKVLHESKIKHLRIPDAKNDINEDYAKKERRELVFQVLNQLPDKEKNLLLLYQVLNINPNYVGKFLERSITKLKLLLKTNYHELFR